MLRIRLMRVGKRNQPSYRIVVADSRAPRNTRTVDWIGNYNPLRNPPDVTLDEEKAKDWLKKGASPSEAVDRILVWKGVRERKQAAAETQAAPAKPKMSKKAAAKAAGPKAP